MKAKDRAPGARRGLLGGSEDGGGREGEAGRREALSQRNQKKATDLITTLMCLVAEIQREMEMQRKGKRDFKTHSYVCTPLGGDGGADSPRGKPLCFPENLPKGFGFQGEGTSSTLDGRGRVGQRQKRLHSKSKGVSSQNRGRATPLLRVA